MNGEQVLAKGLIERIGMEGSVLKHTPTGKYTVDISAVTILLASRWRWML